MVPLTAQAFRQAGGRLALDFAAREGRTFLARQYASYPFHVCKAQHLDEALPGLATLYTQSCSGGLYEGDDLRLEVTVQSGAQAHVTTQASTIAHAMPAGEARQAAHLRAEDGGYLEYLPDPAILFPNSQLVSEVRVAVAPSAVVVASDGLLLHRPPGLKGEPRRYASAIRIEDETGRLLAADRLELTAAEFAERRPGLLGGFPALGTLLIVARTADVAAIPAAVQALGRDGRAARIGASLLPGGAGVLCRCLAPDGAALKRSLNELWNIARLVLLGLPATPRRK